jgi:hypothetical protein
VHAFVARTTEASGVPYHVEDEATLDTLAALLSLERTRERPRKTAPVNQASTRKGGA